MFEFTPTLAKSNRPGADRTQDTALPFSLDEVNGVCVGYLLGHLQGLEKHGFHEAPGARQLLSENPLNGDIISRLERALNERWLSEFGWASLEVFAPVYDLLCELIALHGMAFARHGEEWRIVVSDEEARRTALKDFLLSKAREEPRSNLSQQPQRKEHHG